METTQQEQLKEKYFNAKKELEKLRSDITLQRWKILSKAYKTGRRIWGRSFTKDRLAFDMETPLTTTLRCLSLDRANNRSWKLVKEGKLSVFKLAMVCHSKSKSYQDEIVDMIIKDELSTYQIKSLKVRGIQDINKERQRLSCERGYSRGRSAYTKFNTWIEGGRIFLLMDKKHLPENKVREVELKLKNLKREIELYIKIKPKDEA